MGGTSGDATQGGSSGGQGSSGGASGGSGAGTGAGGAGAVFDKALGDFDGVILQGRSRTSSGEGSSGSAPGAGESSGGTGSGAGDRPGGTESSSGAGNQGGGSDSTGGGGGMPSAGGGGGQEQGGISGGFPGQVQEAPEDIPASSDDDVLARQLREAAMNETDPELREKLWEEYRRYKQG